MIFKVPSNHSVILREKDESLGHKLFCLSGHFSPINSLHTVHVQNKRCPQNKSYLMFKLFTQMAFDRLFDKTGILMGWQLWNSCCLGKRTIQQAQFNVALGIPFVDDKCYFTAVCSMQRCTAVLHQKRSISLQCYFIRSCYRFLQFSC